MWEKDRNGVFPGVLSHRGMGYVAQLHSMGLKLVCCSHQESLQVSFQIIPLMCEGPVVSVALHGAQLALEASLVGLDILRTVFASAHKQSPSKLHWL